MVLAVPSQSLRSNLSQWRIPENAIVVSLAKGNRARHWITDE